MQKDCDRIADSPVAESRIRDECCLETRTSLANALLLSPASYHCKHIYTSDNASRLSVSVDSLVNNKQTDPRNLEEFISYLTDYKDSMSRHPPTTLATVLENMPLVYNSTTKRLEKQKHTYSKVPDEGDEQERDSPTLPTKSKGNYTCLVDDNANEEMDEMEKLKRDLRNGVTVGAMSAMHQSLSAGKIGARDPQKSAAQEETSPEINKKPFRKGHARHSSYESAQIMLQPFAMSQMGHNGQGVARTSSLHQTTDSMSSSQSIGSLSFYSDSAMSIECTNNDKGGPGSTARDSGLGDSKRSSLDRRSQCSALSTACDWVDEPCANDDDQTLTAESLTDFSKANSNHKRRIPLPNITLPRGLFSRKSSGNQASTPWKLFGGHRTTAAGSEKSTTALILNQRPAALPAKPECESAKHQKEYERILEAAKRKEAKEAKLRKKADELQKKLEDQQAEAVREWTNDILPRWDDMRNGKRTRELWWNGIPPSVRGKVWSLSIGNDLNLTDDLFHICLERAKERLASVGNGTCGGAEEDGACQATPSTSNCQQQYNEDDAMINREKTVEDIHLDVSRTFPQLGLFQQGSGPYCDLLLNLLSAYVCYRPDVGYVQGMSFIAAVLLLNLEENDAFIAFANLLNRPLPLAFFRLRRPAMTNYFCAFDIFLKQELPRLHQHFETLDVKPDLYMIEWVYTVFAKSLPLDVTCRVWDVFLRDGDDFFFKTALGILRLYEGALLALDFDECVQFLTGLPDNMNGADLFNNIEPFMREPALSSRPVSPPTFAKRRPFAQILKDLSSNKLAVGAPSPSPSEVFLKGHGRRPSDASVVSATSSITSSKKSVSGFLSEWLGSDSTNN